VRPVAPPAASAPAPAKLAAQQAAAQARAAADKAHKQELADAKAKKLKDLADKKRADQAAREAAAAAAEAAAPPTPKPAIKLAATNAAPRFVPAPAAAPAEPSAPSRGFSSSPVSGGAPPFPQDDDYQGKAGQVTVNCRIEQDGRPAGCSVVAAKGGPAFKSSVLRWLNSGRVRYAPIVRNGQTVSETHQWSVQFRGEQ
jgi:TonB family protein